MWSKVMEEAQWASNARGKGSAGPGALAWASTFQHCIRGPPRALAPTAPARRGHRTHHGTKSAPGVRVETPQHSQDLSLAPCPKKSEIRECF